MVSASHAEHATQASPLSVTRPVCGKARVHLLTSRQKRRHRFIASKARLCMRIVMIGTGYVGLVSGACFADFGHHVTCVDKDTAKIEALKRGEIQIFEPDLDRLVHSNAAADRLDFTTDLTTPVGEADAVFIAVGTPSRRGDGQADLSYVRTAAQEIAAALKDFTVVVTKSTVPVGTGDEVERLMREANPAADVAVASNPEFLREGAAIRDFKFPDRIVAGTSDERARKVLSDI